MFYFRTIQGDTLTLSLISGRYRTIHGAIKNKSEIIAEELGSDFGAVKEQLKQLNKS